MESNPELYLLAFLASMISVFLKTYQTINVQKKMYYFIPPISLMMAVIEVYTVAVQAKHGLSLIVLAFGLGAGCGSVIAVFLHDRLSKEG